MTTYTIWVDGGCKNNGKESASAYFSMAIIDGNEFAVPFTLREERSSAHTHALPSDIKATNNVAELYAWITALNYVRDWAERAHSAGKTLPNIVVKGDSEYVINFIKGINKKTKTNQALIANLKQLACKIAQLPSVTIEHVDREQVVEVLGH